MQTQQFLPRSQFSSLLNALQSSGYRCIGPTVRDGAIVYTDVETTADFPKGFRDRQAPGDYHLENTGDDRLFAWANGPQALKPLTFAPAEPLWRVARDSSGALAFTPFLPEPAPTAVFGVRACDLAALQIQTQHFQDDPYFQARRASLFLIAIHCSHPAATCFCAATGDGPNADTGFDLALHELDSGFLISAGSETGEQLLASLSLQAATASHQQQAVVQSEQARAVQTRSLPGHDLTTALFAQLEHPRWQALGERCLSCGNCTAVCPTCFCHAQTEHPKLDGEASLHTRQWDSCFTSGHSYIHGITLRSDTASRYRQWLTHKLGSWQAQFGRSGCVGCGRCITWCPVGIDLTEEVAQICEQAADG